MLGLYGVEATMEHACLLADVLVAAGEQVGGALRALAHVLEGIWLKRRT
jgi:hypothetical protein